MQYVSCNMYSKHAASWKKVIPRMRFFYIQIEFLSHEYNNTVREAQKKIGVNPAVLTPSLLSSEEAKANFHSGRSPSFSPSLSLSGDKSTL